MSKVNELEINNHYVYKMYNRGKKKVQEYPVVYWGKDGESYVFDMLNVDGKITLTEEQVIICIS